MNKLLYLLLIIPFIVFAQNKKVIYKVTLNDFSEVTGKAYNHLHATNYAKDFVSFDLIYNLNEMSFKSHKMVNLSGEEYENLLIICDVDVSYYKNKESDLLYKIYEKGNLKNIASTSKIITNWTYSTEQKMVLGYKCHRADCTVVIDYGDGKLLSTYPITAWYCSEIQSSFGPKGFGGLKGLILELKQNFVTFTATDLKETDEIPSKIGKGIKIIKEDELVEYIEKMTSKK